MFTLIIVLISIIAVLMTLAILLQSGKGGGLAGIASGGATTQILGSRQAPDFLERATWTMSTAFIVLCILSNFVIDRAAVEGSVIQQQSQGQIQTAPALPAPADATGDESGAGTPPAEDGNQ